MLVPAILFKSEIEEQFQKAYYTTDMMYEQGYLGSNVPEIDENTDGNTYQYAILNSNQKLIGYLSYTVDWYSSSAYSFTLFSFDKGSVAIGRSLFEELEKLLKEYKLHRIEWRAVEGNPAIRSYDRFCQKYNGNKLELKDVFKDRYGEYHDIYVYEIINKEVN
jgi:hypothetical protein